MKEELQSKLVEILASIQTAAGKASDFALEQLPDIAQSYVLYGRVATAVHSGAFLLVSVLFASLAIYAFRKPWNLSLYSFNKHAKRSDSNYVAMILGSAAALFFFFTALFIFDWLVWIAPKVWLLKELASLIK